MQGHADGAWLDGGKAKGSSEVRGEGPRKAAGVRSTVSGECAAKGSAERTNRFEEGQGRFGRFAVGSGNGWGMKMISER